MASKVLPQPALPQTSVGRPRGRPPPVISSSPSMPVVALGRERLFGFWLIAALLIHCPRAAPDRAAAGSPPCPEYGNGAAPPAGFECRGLRCYMDPFTPLEPVQQDASWV